LPMTLQEVRDVFVSVLPNDTYHYEATGKPQKYIIWAEEGQTEALHADDIMQEQVIEGTVDLFTKTEYDPLFKEIQNAMNRAGLSWRLESIQREEATKYYHYEWVWEVVL
jgi:hypothetical protein